MWFSTLSPYRSVLCIWWMNFLFIRSLRNPVNKAMCFSLSGHSLVIGPCAYPTGHTQFQQRDFSLGLPARKLSVACRVPAGLSFVIPHRQESQIIQIYYPISLWKHKNNNNESEHDWMLWASNHKRKLLTRVFLTETFSGLNDIKLVYPTTGKNNHIFI